MAEKTRGIKIEQGAKRVRAYLTGEVVADTKTPFLVWEWPYYPTYYFLSLIHISEPTRPY